MHCTPIAMYDLRSDTLTKPTPAMRAAMAQAEVGDDCYGEDPTTRQLEETVAERLAKAAALFVPTGTMGNQLALLVQSQRGSEVIVGEGAHIANFEAGAGAAWSGVQCVSVGRDGLFTADDVSGRLRPAREMIAPTVMICIENTHNTAGGRVFPQRDVLAIEQLARERGLALHLDGARLWNASIATGQSEAALASPFDSVSVCFSKGLGAPVGSALCGSRELIARARRYRRMLGGGMRQSGVLAAAALYALQHHRERLALDHRAARELARILADSPWVESGTELVETNIVMVWLREPRAASVVEAAKSLGVLCNAMSPRSFRLVTHLDFPAAAAPAAGELLLRAIAMGCAETH